MWELCVFSCVLLGRCSWGIRHNNALTGHCFNSLIVAWSIAPQLISTFFPCHCAIYRVVFGIGLWTRGKLCIHNCEHTTIDTARSWREGVKRYAEYGTGNIHCKPWCASICIEYMPFHDISVHSAVNNAVHHYIKIAKPCVFVL